MEFFQKSQKEISILKNGGVGVMPTDTIYGLVGSALSKEAIRRIYSLKERDADKPFIILISNIDQLELFKIVLTELEKLKMEELWKEKPTSIVFPVTDSKLEYLTRGGGTLAFRVPQNLFLRSFIQSTGPLVAPSANIQGNEPSTNILQSKKVFGGMVDFYIDGGEIIGSPSRVISLADGNIKVLRA